LIFNGLFCFKTSKSGFLPQFLPPTYFFNFKENINIMYIGIELQRL